MRNRPRRRFTARDFMVVIAGIAVSFWIVPEGVGSATDIVLVVLRRVAENPSAHLIFHYADSLWTHFGQPVAAVWASTIVALELMRREDPLRRPARRPGFIACAAVVLAVLIAGSLRFAATPPNLSPGLPIAIRLQAYLGDALAFQHSEGGIAVATAWLVLMLGGRWRPRPDWSDRCGRALGALWILMIPVALLGRGLLS